MFMKDAMTLSILAFDPKTGTLAGAAATGSLCVGGWVLRGDIDAGLVASQGTAPSTFWRDDCLRLLHSGEPVEKTVKEISYADSGRANRQLLALDKVGGTSGFTGSQSVPFAAHRIEPNLAVAGNMLAGPEVLDALQSTFIGTSAPAADKLIAALRAADLAGGDSRGLMSAALLVLSPDAPPVDLRIDLSSSPIQDLEALLSQTRIPPYVDWLDEVPIKNDRQRATVEANEIRTAK